MHRSVKNHTRATAKIPTAAVTLLSATALTLAFTTPAAAFSASGAQYVRLKGTSPVFALASHTLYHIPDAALMNALGSWSDVQTTSSLSGDTVGLPVLVPYPSGTLLKTPGQPAVYLVWQGILRHIASGQVFSQMGLDWQSVRVVPEIMANWPVGSSLDHPVSYWPSGTVLRVQDQPDVYEVVNQTLHHIPSAAMFHSLGYHWRGVRSVAALPYPVGSPMTSPQRAYPTGTLLQVAGHPSVYADEAGKLRHIPSAAMLRALGYHFTEILTAPSLMGNPVGPPLGDTSLPSAPPPAPVSPPAATAPAASSAFYSMGYGYYADNEPNGPSNSSYQDLLQNAQGLSVINPVWYFVQGQGSDWQVTNWTSSIPAQSGQDNVSVVTQEAHREGLLVLPSVGIYYSPSSGPISTPSEQQALVQQLVSVVQQNNYDGLTIDFESQGSGSLSVTAASQQYTAFIQLLGTALHQMGKKLMIAVYASPYPATIYNYAALAPYVNWINIMAYPQHNSATPAGPTQGYPWVEGIVSTALATGISPSQIILGVAPYGHSWTYSNSGVTAHTYESNRAIHTYISTNNIVPVWDPREKAIVFTTGALAQTPPAPLSYNTSQALDSVKNLQAVLNIVLLDYAVSHGQTVPPMLWADGYYGSYTAQAVTTFQQEFNVQGAQPGVYDGATQQALSQAIAQDDIGQTQWWDETSRSFGDLLKLSLQDHLAGVASWRLPFESAGYWSTLTSMTTIWHE